MSAESVGPTQARLEELAGSLARVRARIRAACAAADRTDEVHLVVITKYFPATDVVLLAELGVTDVGENKAQEATAKFVDLPRTMLRRHFVGQVQTNKARLVADWADVVQSVDRPKLVGSLDRAAADEGRRLDVLIQVGLDPQPPQGPAPRGGVVPDEVLALADLVAGTAWLDLRGVMAVAPRDVDPAAAFSVLAGVADRVRAHHPLATWMSAGMSGDLEAAVAAGATHLRVGTAILGSRPSHG